MKPPTLCGLRYKPLPNATLSIVLLCLLFSSNCCLASFASFTAFAIPAAQSASALVALKPANTGMRNGNIPPVFAGTGKMREISIFFLPPASLTALRAFFKADRMTVRAHLLGVDLKAPALTIFSTKLDFSSFSLNPFQIF